MGPSARFDPADPLISADFAGWWRRSTRIITSGWRPLLRLLLLSAAVQVVVQTPVVTMDYPGSSVAFVIAVVLFLLVIVLVEFLVLLAGVRMVVVIAGGGVPRVGWALRGALPRLLPMIGWSVPGGLLAIVALVACLLPVLYVAAVLMILPAVVVFERGTAIGRCFRLFHADLETAVLRAVGVIGLFVAVQIAVLVVLALINLLLGEIPAAVPGTTGQAVVSVAGTGLALLPKTVVSTAATLVLIPFIVTAYADLRARHEPLTADVLVRQLDASGTGRPS